jgi:hypothetical protein
MQHLLGTAGAIEPEEIDQLLIRRNHSLSGVYNQRKERDDEREQGHAEKTGTEPDHANGREDGKWGHLQGHQIGIEARPDDG